MRIPDPGSRVVIRYRVGDQASDALGTVLSCTDAEVGVDTQRGPVTIPRDDILLVHEVPPAPQRTGRLHEVLSAADIRRISAGVWLPEDVTWLNADNLRGDDKEEATFVQTGWLLRSAGGASLRADSALPLSPPGMDPAQALDLTETWYAQRSRPPVVQIYSEHGQTALAPICAELAELFRSRGYAPGRASIAFTAGTRELTERSGTDPVPDGLRIVESDDVHAIHFEAWGRPAEHPGHERFAQLLRSAEQLRFFSAVAEQPDGSQTLVGTVRLTITRRWAIASQLIVAPQLRRRGAGAALIRAAAAAAAARGVRSLLAEVEVDNAAALGLFESLGAAEHHRFWFASQQPTA